MGGRPARPGRTPPRPDERPRPAGAGAVVAPTAVVLVDEPGARVAPGQSVVLYRGDAVVGGGAAWR